MKTNESVVNANEYEKNHPEKKVNKYGYFSLPKSFYNIDKELHEGFAYFITECRH
jgi:hypothetical protein